MGGHHHHHHDHHDHAHEQGQDGSRSNILVAFWLNTFFALLEIAGGLYTNSVAILSDALHDLGDSLSLGLSWYFQKKSETKRDQKYSYGYRRYSLAGAFVNSLILFSGSVLVIIEAIKRLSHPAQPDAKGMILFAVIGVLVNAAALLRLRKGQSMNEKVISLHFLEDVLGWIAVLIGAVVMLFADIPVLDPILSLLIAAYILFNVYKNLRSVIHIMLQGVPPDVSEEDVHQKLSAVKEISKVHDLHIWTMDGRFNILTMHAVVDKSLSLGEVEMIKKKIRKELSELKIQHATIELETSNAHCELGEC